MFNNIGRKIQIAAKVFCWIGIVCSVAAGIIMLGNGVMQMRWSVAYGLPWVLGGIAAALVGSLASWVSSFMMVGFGILVERCEEIAENTRKTNY